MQQSSHHSGLRWRFWALALVGAACSASPPTGVPCRGGCEPGSVCNFELDVCMPVAPVDSGSGCALDADCGSPSMHCLLAEARCVSCLSDEHCAGYCATAVHECRPLPDSCATAQRLDLSSGLQVVNGNTTRAADDAQLSCKLPGSLGNDLVYVFELTERRRVTATATPHSGSALQPIVELRANCSNDDPKESLGCAFPAASAGESRLSVDGLSPGTYFLWVDGEASSAGAFELQVVSEAADTGESCSSPTVLTTANGIVEVAGDTRVRKDDVATSCGGQGAGDAVYAFSLTTPRRLTLDVVSPDPSFHPVVALRGSSCGDGANRNQLGCATAAGGQGAHLDFATLEVGQYHVLVDGLAAENGGPYQLTMTLLDPVGAPGNDTCAAAEPLTLPSGGLGSVTVAGDTTAASSNTGGSCEGSGPDVVYQLTLSAPRRVVATVKPSSGSQLKPSVYLRRDGACDSDALADQLGCATAVQSGAAGVLVLPTVPAGTWYLWVDGQLGTRGAFDLTVDVAAAPPVPVNDSCAMPQAISLVNSPVTVTGTTFGAVDDEQTCAVPSGGYSPDVVYALTVGGSSPRSLGLDVTALTPGYRPVVSLRSATMCMGGSTSSMACAWSDAFGDDRLALTWPSVEPGQYFLWVEGDDYTQGDFSLRLQPGDQIGPPANDACAGAATLLSGVVGDTRGANNTGQGTCGFAGSNGEFGSDVVYKVVLLSPQVLTVTVTPDANEGRLFRPVVYVRSSCGTTSTQLGCRAATDYGQPVTVSTQMLQPGTYYVWVDGAGFSSGRFSIR